MIDKIEALISEIYKGNLKNIDVEIINVLTDAMSKGVKSESGFFKVLTMIENELKAKNYVFIVDLLEFELKPICK